MVTNIVYFFYYKDSIGKYRTIKYLLHEYLNLMDLLFDKGYEDWGDCKSRAWCGTCHIFIEETVKEPMDEDERHTLGNLPNKTDKSRLACQISLNEALHKKNIRFLGDFDH